LNISKRFNPMLIHALRNLLPRHAQTRYLGILLASWLLVFGLTRAGLLALNREVADLSGRACCRSWPSVRFMT
jgi:hypothetical protein